MDQNLDMLDFRMPLYSPSRFIVIASYMRYKQNVLVMCQCLSVERRCVKSDIQRSRSSRQSSQITCTSATHQSAPIGRRSYVRDDRCT